MDSVSKFETALKKLAVPEEHHLIISLGGCGADMLREVKGMIRQNCCADKDESGADYCRCGKNTYRPDQCPFLRSVFLPRLRIQLLKCIHDRLPEIFVRLSQCVPEILIPFHTSSKASSFRISLSPERPRISLVLTVLTGIFRISDTCFTSYPSI